MGNILNSTKAAELVESSTGRRCSRQNLEKLCDRGALQGSPCIVQKKPWRIDGDLVAAEFLAKVSQSQAEAEQPRAKRERPAAPPAPPPRRQPPAEPEDPEDLPEYNVSRARAEYEKANLLELQRKTQEGQLLRREDAEAAWSQAVNITKSRLRGVPSAVKQRVPHLEPEEVGLMVQLIDEALNELSAGEVTK